MRKWILPQSLLATSIQIMAPHGLAGNEGLSLWLGREEGEVATVTHALKLRGSGLITRPLQLQLSDRAMSQITDVASNLDLFLVGQIHSHPGRFIDLSDVDIKYGIRIDEYLSLVCPHYAQRSDTSWSDCGLHVFDTSEYRPMGPSEIRHRIHFDEQASLTVIDIEVFK